MLDLNHQNQWRETYRAAHPGWRPATELYYSTVIGLLRPGMRILDVGCGRGGLVEQLPAPRPWVIGLDPDYQSLAEHRISTLPRVASFSDWLPFSECSFDLIVASWLMEHLEYPQRTLAEIARVLETDGRFVFITPNGRHPLTIANRLFGRAGRLQKRLVDQLYAREAADTFPTQYRANTPTAIQTLAANNGLRVDSLVAVADPTYLAFTSSTYRLMAKFEDHLPPDRHIHLVGVLQK